jgi:hypothetical protein
MGWVEAHADSLKQSARSCVLFGNIVPRDTLQSWCCFCDYIEKDNVDIFGIKY